MLQQPADKGLAINADKYKFERPAVFYLGHLVSTNGCHPQQLHRFLGIIIL